MLSRAHVITSLAVSSAPGFGTTIAFTDSPRRVSRVAMTHASFTPGQAYSVASRDRGGHSADATSFAPTASVITSNERFTKALPRAIDQCAPR
jgi:hypothetical protein